MCNSLDSLTEDQNLTLYFILIMSWSKPDYYTYKNSNVTWWEGTFVFSQLLYLQRCDSLGVCVPLGWDCAWMCVVFNILDTWEPDEFKKGRRPVLGIGNFCFHHSQISFYEYYGSEVWTARYYRERGKNEFSVIMCLKACILIIIFIKIIIPNPNFVAFYQLNTFEISFIEAKIQLI